MFLNGQMLCQGASTTFDIPPSPNVTIHDYIGFGYLDRDRRIYDLIDVNKGSYCYWYEY